MMGNVTYRGKPSAFAPAPAHRHARMHSGDGLWMLHPQVRGALGTLCRHGDMCGGFRLCLGLSHPPGAEGAGRVGACSGGAGSAEPGSAIHPRGATIHQCHPSMPQCWVLGRKQGGVFFLCIIAFFFSFEEKSCFFAGLITICPWWLGKAEPSSCGSGQLLTLMARS